MELTAEIIPVENWIPTVSTINFVTQLQNANLQLSNLVERMNMGRTADVSITDRSFRGFEFANRCKPVRGIKRSADWLSVWEALNETFGHFTDAARNRINRKKQPEKDDPLIPAAREYSINSFHIGSNADVINATLDFGSRISRETYVPVTVSWIANGVTVPQTRDCDRWIVGVDGTGNCTTANLRAWKNRIITEFRRLDLITSVCPNNATGAIVFTLMNLSVGGCAVISIENIFTAKTISLVHAFASHFKNAGLLYTKSDTVYLYGVDLKERPKSRAQNILIDYLDQVEYKSLYSDPDQITKFATLLEKAQEQVFKKRYEWINNVFCAYIRIRSLKLFPGAEKMIIDELTPDQTEEWIMNTGYAL